MTRRALPMVALVALAIGAVAVVVAATAGEDFRSGTFDPPRVAPPFTVEGSNGAKLSLARFRGKVVVLEFGFTHCQTVCPVTLANLAAAMRALGPKARDVQVIFVTVDPARDSPARLREYLTAFHPAFLGGTAARALPDGSAPELDALRRAYGVEVTRAARQDDTGYDVHHSSSLYLIDRAGRLRVLVPFGKPVGDLVHDLSLLLDE